jgi:hypothetical protein
VHLHTNSPLSCLQRVKARFSKHVLHAQLPCSRQSFIFKSTVRSLGEDTHLLSNMLAAQFKMARRLHSLRNGNVETHQPIIHPAFSYMNLRHCRSSPYHHQASLKSKRSIGILARAASVGDDGKFSFRLEMKLALQITPSLIQGCT